MIETRWVALGQVLRPHGIRGELRVHLHNEESRAVEPGATVGLRAGVVQGLSNAGGKAVSKANAPAGGKGVVERVRYVPGGLLLKIEGVDTREAAEALRGVIIEMPREALPELASGEYYACDLVGAKVLGPEGMLGTVRDVATYPSTDALVVELESHGSGSVEIPLIDDFIASVDLAEHVIEVHSAALALFSS